MVIFLVKHNWHSIHFWTLAACSTDCLWLCNLVLRWRQSQNPSVLFSHGQVSTNLQQKHNSAYFLLLYEYSYHHLKSVLHLAKYGYTNQLSCLYSLKVNSWEHNNLNNNWKTKEIFHSRYIFQMFRKTVKYNILDATK